MTTVLHHGCPKQFWTHVAGRLQWAWLVILLSGLTATAQGPPVHWLHAGAMPPGAIGSQRLLRGGPLLGYIQPVRIGAPEGVQIALAAEGGFHHSESQFDSLLVGMQIGPVYRVRVSGIPNHPGAEVYPTVEIIDRLYPPPGLASRYPIPIELTQEELDMAVRGMFVTRVIYVENPNQAIPVAQSNDALQQGEQPWIEAQHGQDPLVMADHLGRPVAILRMGSRRPPEGL